MTELSSEIPSILGITPGTEFILQNTELGNIQATLDDFEQVIVDLAGGKYIYNNVAIISLHFGKNDVLTLRCVQNDQLLVDIGKRQSHVINLGQVHFEQEDQGNITLQILPALAA